MSFQAATAKEVDDISSSFVPREMSHLEMSARNARNSRSLARKAAEYRAKGNEKMAAVCEERANMAFARSVKS